ncbi:hypothetical protein Sjap_001382 [Stephania japonica]|uniref:Uncharacterized protein n=1 Tax=Stephania japonica TaxID=461633 RepID=A0AAP0KM54_9MAGN
MGRAPCCDKANVKKGPWSPEEDSKLKDYIEKYGTGGNWIALPHKAGLKRCGKSCRLRWLNYLRPNIKHGEFSDDEDRIICSLFASIGSRWSIIAAQLPGRTDNDIKNYWNTKLKKKLVGSMLANININSNNPSSSSSTKIPPQLSQSHHLHHSSPSSSPSLGSHHHHHHHNITNYSTYSPTSTTTTTTHQQPMFNIATTATHQESSLNLMCGNNMPHSHSTLIMFGPSSCNSSDGSSTSQIISCGSKDNVLVHDYDHHHHQHHQYGHHHVSGGTCPNDPHMMMESYNNLYYSGFHQDREHHQRLSSASALNGGDLMSYGDHHDQGRTPITTTATPTSTSTTPLDEYGTIEEIKQLVMSSNNNNIINNVSSTAAIANNNLFFFDENKTQQGKVMYYY